jgi:DNA-binding MarR family transcriptional regulator
MDDKELRAHFGHIHAQNVAALSRHLITCRRFFDGDLDLFLVLMIIGERTFSRRNAPDLSFEQWQTASVRSVKQEAINLQSIADYSGIPRETVRRKVEILVQRGWVVRDGRKYISATDKARDELMALTESGLRYLAELRASFTQLSDA